MSETPRTPNGWDEVNGVANPTFSEQHKNAAEIAAIAMDFKDLFGSDTGKRVLEYLKKTYMERPPIPQQAVDGMAFALLQNLLIGESNLVRRIIVLINYGEENNVRPEL